jgi:hypothetical protein
VQPLSRLKRAVQGRERTSAPNFGPELQPRTSAPNFNPFPLAIASKQRPHALLKSACSIIGEVLVNFCNRFFRILAPQADLGFKFTLECICPSVAEWGIGNASDAKLSQSKPYRT